MNGHDGETCVASLLESFNEQRSEARRRDYVRVEIVPFDSRGVRQDNPANANGGQLRPQSSQHLGAGKREQHIDGWAFRCGGLERATQRDRPGRARHYHAGSPRTIHNADADDGAGRDIQDMSQMVGPCPGHDDLAGAADLGRIDEHVIHGPRVYRVDAWIAARQGKNSCRTLLQYSTLCFTLSQTNEAL